MDQPILFCGIGNPGDRFAGTRHNVGFSFVEALAARLSCPLRRRWFRPLVIGGPCESGAGPAAPVVLARPLTYMNRSGDVLPWISRRYHVPPERVCIVVDNIDLAPGEVRMKRRGGAASHNGLRSVSAALGTDEYPRIYFGVGRPDQGGDIVQHVLGEFAPDEQERIDAAILRTIDVLTGLNGATVEQMISGVNEIRRPPEE
ncbi:MAG: aminoacyl-tRNA hydrolase [Spirochaeta sp.]|nr:aminoacyl-tRNA hydrolase [Spirochaeta sp.]